MNEILCSTGALIGRPNGRDYHLLAQLAKKLACDGFEFMMYSTWYDSVEEIIGFLKEQEFYIPVMHCEKHIGQKIGMGAEDLREAIRLFGINCHMANALQADKLVVHLWDGLISDRNFANNLAAYRELAAIAKEYGVELLVENVVCNHEDPMKHWQELAERYPDIRFIFDTKMAAFHGQMDLLYEKEYEWLWKKRHIAHYHVNDYAGGYMEWEKLKTLPIGEGNIDFSRFFSFIHEIDYHDTFTVEATAFRQDGTVDTDMLNRCFGQIRNYLKE